MCMYTFIFLVCTHALAMKHQHQATLVATHTHQYTTRAIDKPMAEALYRNVTE